MINNRFNVVYHLLGLVKLLFYKLKKNINMKKKNLKKTDKEISDEIKQALFIEINNTINDEIIKSLKTGKKCDCLIPMKKSK
jgi:hypothetical protein